MQAARLINLRNNCRNRIGTSVSLRESINCGPCEICGSKAPVLHIVTTLIRSSFPDIDTGKPFWYHGSMAFACKICCGNVEPNETRNR